MIVRRAEEKDLLELTRWFESVSWDLPPVQDVIPTEDGYVAEEDGVLCACAFLYMTGTSCAFLQWTNVNPDVSHEMQSSGIDAIISKLQAVSMSAVPPLRTFVTFTKSEKFAQKLKGLGFRSSYGFHQCTWVAKKNATEVV
jgi:N-acetylglutamate synthase-like GNAT family acetyltransferase